MAETTLTHDELRVLRYPLAPEHQTRHLDILTRLGWDEGDVATSGQVDGRRVYYGPHPCERCGAMIVKAAREQGGLEFDQPDGPVYPNTYWRPHDCPAQPKPEPHEVRPHTPGWGVPLTETTDG